MWMQCGKIYSSVQIEFPFGHKLKQSPEMIVSRLSRILWRWRMKWSKRQIHFSAIKNHNRISRFHSTISRWYTIFMIIEVNRFIWRTIKKNQIVYYAERNLYFYFEEKQLICVIVFKWKIRWTVKIGTDLLCLTYMKNLYA